VSYRQVAGVVGPSKPRVVHARCAGPTPVAISGFLGAPNDAALRSIALTESGPFGRGHAGWTVAVSDLGNSPQPYFAGVICVSANARVSFKSVSRVISPTRVGGANVRCPASAPEPISGFVYQRNGTGDLVVSEFAPTPGAWATLVRNIGNQQQRYVAGAVCAPRSLPVRYLWSNKLTAAPNALDGGWGRCQTPTRYAVAGAFAPPANSGAHLGNIALVGSYPFGPGTGKPVGSGISKWTSVILNLSASPQDFYAGTVCIG
jgi:hypothetical protein